VDEGHARALCEIQAAAELGRAEHSDDGHAVHVVCYRFAMGDAEAAPAFPFSRFQALEEVEER